MSNPSDDELRRIYRTTETIAVVGASNDPNKHSHTVPKYLQSQGYRIVPVSVRGGEILGEPAYTSLGEVDVPVDVVDVFRPSREVSAIARDAAAIGAKVLWLQRGIVSDDGRRIAADHGLTYVEDICMRATHVLLGLGQPTPLPDPK